MRSSCPVSRKAPRLPILLLLLPLLATCDGDPTGPAKATIGEDGGTAKLAQGSVELSIPRDALLADVELTATQATSHPSDDLLVPGSVYDIGPAETSFEKLITITLSYDPDALPEGVRETELRLFHVVEGRWELLLGPSVDTNANTVSGRVTSLGCFGVLGIPVAFVEISWPFYALETGKTKGFTAGAVGTLGMALPERAISWTSSDESVATVDADGFVTGVGIGSSTITASAEGRSSHARIETWSCTWQPEIPTAECRALIDLYDAMNEEDWRYSEAWITTPYPCGWLGVGCAGGSVATLVLNSRQGQRSIPSSIEDLSNLMELDLARNRFSGPIPASLGNLSMLSSLNLFGNLLSGGIPAELQNLTALSELNLGNNELTGPIPPGFGGLSNLTVLELGRNNLSGTIPPELGNLSELEDLSLIDNQLSGSIPATLGNLSELQHLSLSFNLLTGRIPSEIGNLLALTNLGISRTQVSGPIPASLGNLTKLEVMILNANRLSGQVPLLVAQLGGQIQAKDGGVPNCSFAPQEGSTLTMPDTQDYRGADLNADGKICDVVIGAG